MRGKMNWYKKAQTNDSPENAKYFRGISEEEAKMIMSGGRLQPSIDLIPFDSEVLEYAIGGDEYARMSERQIERWIKGMIPWYNGRPSSVEGGVNLTMDFVNAQGYGEYVAAINADNEVVEDISDAHAFARSADGLRVIGLYNVDTRRWMTL